MSLDEDQDKGSDCFGATDRIAIDCRRVSERPRRIFRKIHRIAALVVLIGWRLSANDRSSAVVEALIARTERIDEVERAVLLFAISIREVMLDRTPQRLQQFAGSEARLDAAAQRPIQRGPGGLRPAHDQAARSAGLAGSVPQLRHHREGFVTAAPR